MCALTPSKLKVLNFSLQNMSYQFLGEIETMGINPFVRHGFRTLTNLTDNASVKDKEAIADVDMVQCSQIIS